MITVEMATEIIQQHFAIRPSELNFDITADRNYPPFDRVMMDGIAVRFDAYQSGQRDFPILGINPAGEAAKTLTNQSGCFEVMTGAPMPIGTDLVIPYEHLELKDNSAKVVRELDRIKGENIHPMGSDCKEGELVLKSGAFMNGPAAGIAASMGIIPETSLGPKILIISTGDELVEVQETPLDHQIRRSNAHALKKSLNVFGFHQVKLDHLKDDAEAVRDHYLQNAEKFDLMIYSGGVSKGKYDYLPQVWKELGVENHFHIVSQRPGKPLWFGTDKKTNTTVVGLPGNPVSSLVCLHRYIVPQRPMFAKLSEEVLFKNNLTYFLPVKVEFKNDGSLWATPLRIKNSGEFTALAGSDGFIELPAEKSVFRAGDAFSFWSWRPW